MIWRRVLRDYVLADPVVDLAVALEEPENRHFASRAATAWAFASAAEVTPVALDLAAQGAVEFALSGEAAADDLINALGAVAVDAHHFRGSARGHFQSEVLDEFVELAVRQLAIFNQSPGHSNSLFPDSCSRQAPNIYEPFIPFLY